MRIGRNISTGSKPETLTLQTMSERSSKQGKEKAADHEHRKTGSTGTLQRPIIRCM